MSKSIQKSKTAGKQSKKSPNKIVSVSHFLVKSHAGMVQNLVRSLSLAKSTADSKSFLDVKTGKSCSSDDGQILALQQQLTAMRSAARSAIGMSKIRTVLYSGGAGNGAANTAIAASIPIVPSAAAEWASYITLYDEVRVTKVVVHLLFGFTAAATASIPGGGAVFCAVGYDSTYNSTPTSVAEVMESSQHKLMSALVALNGTVCPPGAHKFDIHIPSGPVANASAVTGGTGIIANFPGQWMAVGDQADSVGYFRVYVEAGGPSCVMGYRLLTEYHCEFRERT